MNSIHPSYPIMSPNTSYVKQLFNRGPRGSQKSKKIDLMISKSLKDFLITKKKLCIECPKSAVRGCKLIFWGKKS